MFALVVLLKKGHRSLENTLALRSFRGVWWPIDDSHVQFLLTSLIFFAKLYKTIAKANSGKQLQMMEEIIDVDNYKFRLQCILPENIAIVLKRNGLFRLNAFSYTVGDSLFDSFEMLLHFRYTSNELRNALIDHFIFCLKNNDVEAIQSYQYELAP